MIVFATGVLPLDSDSVDCHPLLPSAASFLFLSLCSDSL